MKKTVSVLFVLVLSFCMSISALAYSRNTDAAVYADFNGEDTELFENQDIPGELYTRLNGLESNSKASLVDGALKIELSKGGFAILGQNNPIRDVNTGKVKYKYLVMRIKGETGNENRTEAGGLLLFIGGGDGAHAITLNDRPTGAAPCALDAEGKPMNAISTEWQEFVIELTDSNVRPEAVKSVGFNINTVAVSATLYIDDIYFTDTPPATAAVYDPSKSTAKITKEQNAEKGDTDVGKDSDTDISGKTDADVDNTGSEISYDTNLKRLEPPSNNNTYVKSSSESSTMPLLMFIVCAAIVAVLVGIFILVYIKIILKNI